VVHAQQVPCEPADIVCVCVSVCLCRFVVLHVFLTPVPSSFVRPHAQGSLAVWDSEGLVLSPLYTTVVVVTYVIAGPLMVVVLQSSTSWMTLFTLTTLVSICEDIPPTFQLD